MSFGLEQFGASAALTQLKAAPLPYSYESEKAVIGTLLASPHVILDVAEKIRQDFFFLESHQIIVTIILELALESIPADILNVLERARFKGKENVVGGFEGLRSYLDFAANPENILYWVEQVKQYWELRSVVEKCSDLSERGRQIAGADISQFLEEAEQTFSELAEARTQVGLRTSTDVLRETILKLESLLSSPGGITGVSSGFSELDNVLAGFQQSDLIILAARPAMGKTSLALNFATHAAIHEKKVVAFFNLEMSAHQLMQRILASNARIRSQRFRDGKMSSEDLERLYPEAANLQTDRLLIDDSAGLSLLDVASRCRRLKREKGSCDMVIIDYLQLMTVGNGAGKDERERVGLISRGLKQLAKEISCPIIALSQLSRAPELRPDKRPRPSDLRESGSIEQDADQILFIYRDEVYNPATQDKGIAEVIVGKNRHGPTTTVKLAFQNEFTSFHNLAKM